MDRLKKWRLRRAELRKRSLILKADTAGNRAALKRANRAIRKLSKPKLRVRAFKVAESLVGVVEQGGNNTGPQVTQIIRENGGTYPEPWCGDGMAYCYRHAGSKRVTRAWASVRLIRGLLGIKVTSKPKTGDLVRFNFSPAGDDHVGMFVRFVSPGVIETIEFNTGPTGAVSDSSTGRDGVYRKQRSTTLVHDYLRVLG